MCFSTTASFTAGTILCTTSIVAIKNSKTSGQKIFGLTPFLFGFQQLIEGFVWLSLRNPDFASINLTATYAFVFFAQVFWPTWVPYAMLALEKDKRKRKILSAIGLMGMIASTMLFCRMVFYPVHSYIDNHHILYTFETPYNIPAYLSLLYLLPTILPPFFSSVRKMPLLGGLIVGSLVITKAFYGLYALSVWCFFAAIISVVVIYIIRQMVVEEEQLEMRKFIYHKI